MINAEVGIVVVLRLWRDPIWLPCRDRGPGLTTNHSKYAKFRLIPSAVRRDTHMHLTLHLTLAKLHSECKNGRVRYRIEISKKAREQLRELSKEHRRNIGWRMEEMRVDLRGDVLQLQPKGNFYRLRVGNFRVLFLLAGDAIQVYAVKDRKEAYE